MQEKRKWRLVQLLPWTFKHHFSKNTSCLRKRGQCAAIHYIPAELFPEEGHKFMHQTGFG